MDPWTKKVFAEEVDIEKYMTGVHYPISEKTKDHVHGVMSLGLASAVIAEKFPGSALVKIEKTKFRNEIPAGSHLLISCTVTEKTGRLVRIKTVISNEPGDIVMESFCMIQLPQKQK